MALLPILEYPNPRLRIKAEPMVASDFTPELQQFIDSMFETMYAAPGIGLAATQVDFHKRMLVIDISKDRDEPLVFINPEILSKEGVGTLEEGCLSVPGIFDEVVRAAKIRVKALDRHGNAFERDCDDILAVCVQHEMDHLEGKLFVDYLSDLKRERIRKKLEKDRRDKGSRKSATAAATASI
jgi:peptide deformylase